MKKTILTCSLHSSGLIAHSLPNTAPVPSSEPLLEIDETI